MTSETRDTTLRVAIYTSVACSIAAAIYTLAGLEPSPLISLVFVFAPAITVILWMQKDAQRTGIVGVLDWGLFIWLFWPVVIPWYVFKSRGRQGWRLLLGLFALIWSWYLTAFVTAWIAYSIRQNAGVQ